MSKDTDIVLESLEFGKILNGRYNQMLAVFSQRASSFNKAIAIQKQQARVVEAVRKGHWDKLAKWLDMKFPNQEREVQEDLIALSVELSKLDAMKGEE